MEKDLEVSPTPPNCSKDSWKSLPLFITINWPSLFSCGSKDILKMHPVSSTNTHYGITDLVNQGMV